MPGAYTHLTLATLARDPGRLEAHSLDRAAIRAVLRNSEFVCLGAVSPDYPYLAVADSDAAIWADRMHYENTGVLLKSLIVAVRQLADGIDKERALSWLLGFVSHVAADITIHPVVEARVGPYHGNETAHMRCEMHQDVHVFPKLGLKGGPEVAEYLDATLRQCGPDGQLNAAIADVWTESLAAVHADIAGTNPPAPQHWHTWFVNFVDAAEEAPDLPKFARHVAAHIKPLYPTSDELDLSYIENVETPGGPLHYDAVFDRALRVISDFWKFTSDGVLGLNDDFEHRIENWNLDNGMNEAGVKTAWSAKYD